MNILSPFFVLTSQTLLPVNHVTKEIVIQRDNYFPIKPMDYGKFLILSLCTGSVNTGEAIGIIRGQVGMLNWLTNQGSSPLIECFSQESMILLISMHQFFFEHCIVRSSERNDFKQHTLLLTMIIY
jgi:hypothetical protein